MMLLRELATLTAISAILSALVGGVLLEACGEKFLQIEELDEGGISDVVEGSEISYDATGTVPPDADEVCAEPLLDGSCQEVPPPGACWPDCDLYDQNRPGTGYQRQLQ